MKKNTVNICSILNSAYLILPLLFSAVAVQSDEKPVPNHAYEEVLVTGGKEAIRTLPGSASFIDEEAIAKFDSSDINNLLGQVPGINIRFEDGYGLRPNIGIRGATSERSQKITLMEDGILIAPSPYSAPAAYYFPNVSRMSAVEVFKGPSSIHYGPHTVGGAINLVTPSIPREAEGSLDVTLGTDAYQKYRLFYGDNNVYNNDQFSYWVDVLHYSADGFKDLDGGGDTGFTRNDFNGKLQWHSSDDAAIYQQIDLKLGYADEDSNETYLGLSDNDFKIESIRRYAASQQDEFESEHWQTHFFYHAKLNEAWQINTKIYINRFDRGWNKFDGFISGQAAVTLLANSAVYTQQIALLQGNINSDGSDAQTINVTDFDRSHGSQGLELSVIHQRETGVISHKLEAGLRFHHDYVERDHRRKGYSMANGRLIYAGLYPTQIFNEAETDALAMFFSDELEYKNWKFNLGLRYEDIEGSFTDKLVGSHRNNEQSVLLPGAGVFYQWTEHVGFLLGVNKGFSPAGPGAGSDVDPEESTNFEYGFRYQQGTFIADVIGFFSDYDNLLGRCRVSDVGCTAGEEFNGGAVEIAGVEVTSAYTADLPHGLLMPINLVYTYTETAFQSSFISGFSQWNPEVFNGNLGAVVAGDELPYTPEHQLQLQLGLRAVNWGIDLAINYISEMREVPGRGSFEQGTSTEAYTTFDLAASYQLSDEWQVKLVGKNITDKQVIVSRRPFGARPNQPRLIKVNVSYHF